MFELLCCAWWCCSEAEARNQGLSRTEVRQMSMASHSFGHQRSWGTFSYTVFWCILFDWATLSVPVYWVDTSFSCEEHSFSDKAPKQTSFDAKSHWGIFQDLQWIYHVLYLCYYCTSFQVVLVLSNVKGLLHLALLARAVCILVPEWSVQWYDVIQETDFGSLESHINKTIRPTWATSRLLLSCVSAWLLRSPQ